MGLSDDDNNSSIVQSTEYGTFDSDNINSENTAVTHKVESAMEMGVAEIDGTSQLVHTELSKLSN